MMFRRDSAGCAGSLARWCTRPDLDRSLAVVDAHHRAVLQVLGDGPVAPGDDFLALLQSLDDFDQFVALDAGLHLPGRGPAPLDAEDDLHETILVHLVARLGVLSRFPLLQEL